MRIRIKITLSILLFFLILFIGLNVPVVAFSTWQECDNLGCSTHTAYESYLQQQYGCSAPFSDCIGSHSVETMSLSTLTLHAGESATASLAATSRLQFTLNNPGSPTYTTALTLS